MLYKSIGLKYYLISDGMDRCYGKYGKDKGWDATFGEDFHAFHPLIDKIFMTIPQRIPFKEKYNGIDNHHLNSIKNAKKYGIDVINFSMNPVFIDFFKKYNPSIKDIVYPKLLTLKYVDKKLGMKYYKFCKIVFNKHKGALSPFGSRLIKKINKIK